MKKIRQKRKCRYAVYVIELDGAPVGVYVPKTSQRAFKRLVKSGDTEALKECLSDITDEESERIANGARVVYE